MSWALAALTKLASINATLQAQVDGHDRYTCISKGGEYGLMGTIYGAGKSKGLVGRAYRDTVTGKMYFREPEDFISRMKPIATEQAQ
jgi:hypothetical protein